MSFIAVIFFHHPIVTIANALWPGTKESGIPFAQFEVIFVVIFLTTVYVQLAMLLVHQKKGNPVFLSNHHLPTISKALSPET